MRTRWFMVGVLTGASGMVWFAVRMRRLRDRMRPRAVARRGAGRLADSLEATGRRLRTEAGVPAGE